MRKRVTNRAWQGQVVLLIVITGLVLGLLWALQGRRRARQGLVMAERLLSEIDIKPVVVPR